MFKMLHSLAHASKAILSGAREWLKLSTLPLSVSVQTNPTLSADSFDVALYDPSVGTCHFLSFHSAQCNTVVPTLVIDCKATHPMHATHATYKQTSNAQERSSNNSNKQTNKTTQRKNYQMSERIHIPRRPCFGSEQTKKDRLQLNQWLLGTCHMLAFQTSIAREVPRKCQMSEHTQGITHVPRRPCFG